MGSNIKIKNNVFIVDRKSNKIIFEDHNESVNAWKTRLRNNLLGVSSPFSISDSNLLSIDNISNNEGSQNGRDGIAYRRDGSSVYFSTITLRLSTSNPHALRWRGLFTPNSDMDINALAIGGSFSFLASGNAFVQWVAFVDKASNKTSVLNSQPYEIIWEISFS